MDIDLLRQIGLTEGETKVYLSLLKLGSSTTGPVVDESHVSRSKVYHILERLVEKGLVTHITKEKTKYYQAADPDKLLSYLDAKEKELEENKKRITSLIPELHAFQTSSFKEEAEIYHGLEGVKTARELALNVLKKGETFYCFGANKINYRPLEGYWKDFHRKRAHLGIKAKYLIQEDSRAIMGKGSLYQSKRLIESRYLDTAGPVHIDIFGDYVVTCILQGTYTSFLIKNRFVADYYRDYFEKVWNVAKK